MFTADQLRRGFVAYGHTSEGVPTTASLAYAHDDGDSTYSELLSVTYHYSEVYFDDEDETVYDGRDVTYRQMMRHVADAQTDYGYMPYQ